MTVDYDEECGYLIYAPWYGRYLVSPDGRSVLSAMPNVPLWRWQIVLYAQALPLAATLQGLELLHASAVLVDGKLIAFSAPSGTGKTSTAAHLVAGGATLLTDDVLAIECAGDRILGYPGAPLTKVAQGELATMPATAHSRLGTRIGRNDKILLLAPVPAEPSALDGVYFLQRSNRFRRLSITRLEPNPLRGSPTASTTTSARASESSTSSRSMRRSWRRFHCTSSRFRRLLRPGDVARAVRTHAGQERRAASARSRSARPTGS